MTPRPSHDGPRLKDWRDAPGVADQALADGRERSAWRAVWIRRSGWHPALLTSWSRLPNLKWAALAQWESDGPRWVGYSGASLTPVPPPNSAPVTPAPLTEAEVANCPETVTWSLVWIGRSNSWHPAKLSAWRRLPDRGWAGRLRWGPGEAEIGWVRCTAASVLPILPPDGTPAALTTPRP